MPTFKKRKNGKLSEMHEMSNKTKNTPRTGSITYTDYHRLHRLSHTQTFQDNQFPGAVVLNVSDATKEQACIHNRIKIVSCIIEFNCLRFAVLLVLFFEEIFIAFF